MKRALVCRAGTKDLVEGARTINTGPDGRGAPQFKPINQDW